MISLKSNLKSIVPEKQLSEGHADDVFGNNGLITVYPKTEQEISNLLTYANKENQTVNVMGGGTKKGFGGLVDTANMVLSLREYQGIVEHTQGDMTVTVKSGTPFNELQKYLSQFNQRIPMDPFFPDLATVGGIIAANDSGPKRLLLGSARDSVIGMKIVYPDGMIIRTGGKVVKNVAGYDMNKLFIGSMGTLGVLSEVTFKLRPLPKYESVVLVSFPSNDMDDIRTFCENVLDSMLEPVALELLSPSLAKRLTGNGSMTMAIAFEDIESSVVYQENEIKKLKPDHAQIHILSENEARVYWDAFSAYGPNGTDSISDVRYVESVLKIGVVNMDVMQMIENAHSLSNEKQLEIEAHGGVGHGLCRMIIKGESQRVIDGIKRLREKSEELGGYAIVAHLPFVLRHEINVWGNKPAHFFLLEGIKKAIDPKGLLNRKRFVGGI